MSMTQEEQTALMVRGMIASLPPEQAEEAIKVADQIKQVIAQAGDVGPIALALVGAEFAAQHS